jgi:hypothetical protein
LAGSEEVQQATVTLVFGDIEDVVGDDPQSACSLAHPGVVKPVAAALGSPDPDDGAVSRDAVQRPGRSVKYRSEPFPSLERSRIFRPSLSRQLLQIAGGKRTTMHAAARSCAGRLTLLGRCVTAEGSVTGAKGPVTVSQRDILASV